MTCNGRLGVPGRITSQTLFIRDLFAEIISVDTSKIGGSSHARGSKKLFWFGRERAS
jgi:hypothetical protein